MTSNPFYGFNSNDKVDVEEEIDIEDVSNPFSGFTNKETKSSRFDPAALKNTAPALAVIGIGQMVAEQPQRLADFNDLLSSIGQDVFGFPTELNLDEEARTAESFSNTLQSFLPEEQANEPLPSRAVKGAFRLGSDPISLEAGPLGVLGGLGAGAGSEAGSDVAEFFDLGETGTAAVETLFGLAGGIGASSIAAGKPKIQTKKGQSGLKERRFERLKKKTEVSPSRLNKINKAVENDFKEIADTIISDSPLGETVESLNKGREFKANVESGFEKVESLSKSIDGVVPTRDLTVKLKGKAKAGKQGAISPTEFDANYQKELNKKIKDIKGVKELTPEALVKQYRANNKELREIFEPGSSRSRNNAKKEVLLDYNKSIGEIIEQFWPESEFSKLFEDTNQQWTKIMDAERLNGFIEDLFDGKVNFKAGSKIFNKENRFYLKRALGEDGVKKFDTLMGDLLTKERAFKLLDKAEDGGFDKLRTLGYYFIHPKLAGAKLAKDGYQSAVAATLDKPDLMIKWQQGVRAMRREDFGLAEKIFENLDNEIKKTNITKKELSKRQALKKFNAKKKQPS